MNRLLRTLILCISLIATMAYAFAQSYEKRILADAEKQLTRRQTNWTRGDLFKPLQQPMSDTERRAMRFLYAYMPLSDIADYAQSVPPGEYHLRNVRSALRTRREMPWGASVPDREWYHFVLPVRVNNEGLDSARQVLYAELRDRVAQLSMSDAVLEVNRWCHEHVTYTPSDSRTSSPLSTIRSAYGRCGEESTLLVSALRSVGIPARQVYTPRWAHTDDNHAWVEAWVDGKWRFLGACEPEPVLDLGWFNAPASRAMLVHTRVFGAYHGEEPVISKNECVTEINVTHGYAPVGTSTIRVVDEKGGWVSDAQVEFKIYNYGEFYTVGRVKSDYLGITRFLAGHGDMLVWASARTSSGIRYGFTKVSFGKESYAEVVLRHKHGDPIDERLDIIPPVEAPRYPIVTDAQRAENTRRLAYEDSIRNAYVTSFIDKQIEGLDARGNWSAIQQFLAEAPNRTDALRMLSVISAKDRRDADPKILLSHLKLAKSSYPYTPADSVLVWRYINSPRVATEVMTDYRAIFHREIPLDLSMAWHQSPSKLAEWCRRNISIDNEVNPHNQPMQPLAVWRARIADYYSASIFFVSMARTMGHPARIDDVTGKVQYYDPKDKQWIDVNLERSASSHKTAPTGSLQLSYQYNGIVEDPTYYRHFSLSRINADGQLHLQSYDVDEKGLEQGATWGNTFRKGVSMDAGEYLLITGSRMASGSVLAQLRSLSIKPQSTTQASLVMRRDSTQVAVVGSFNAEGLYQHLGSVGELRSSELLRATQGTSKSVISTTGRGYYILGIIGAQQEPSNHALRDLSSLNDALKAWGRPMLLLFADDTHRHRSRPEEFRSLPAKATLGIDSEGKLRSELIREFKLTNNDLPIFIIADTFNRVVFVKQGYTIGLGEQLKAVIAGLKSGTLSPNGGCTLP